MANFNPVSTTKKVTRKPTPKIWVVLNKARKTFNAQLNKSNEVKRQCVKKFSAGEYADQEKFYNDFMEQVEKIYDSKRFCEAAEAHKVDPKILATHIVFLGSSTINKVLKEGLDNSPVAGDLNLYQEAFMPKTPQEFAE